MWFEVDYKVVLFQVNSGQVPLSVNSSISDSGLKLLGVSILYLHLTYILSLYTVMFIAMFMSDSHFSYLKYSVFPSKMYVICGQAV